MISIQSNDGSISEITPESVKNGQVADACADGDAIEQKKNHPPQSRRENARYAAARRSAERERDEQIARMREDTEREIARRVSETLAARTSPVADATGEGTDIPDSAARENTPPVTDTGRETIAELGRLRELNQKLTDERTRIALDGEIAEVRGRFPEIKSILDIVKLERYPEIKSMVARGYGLYDAVRLTYEDVYVNRRAQAAAREARGALSSGHLRPTSPSSASSVDISEEQIRTYQSAIPGASRDSAIRAYQKYKIKK